MLVDSDPITVIEYADASYEKCVLQVFTKTVHAASITLFPKLNAAESYTLEGKVISALELAEDGICISGLKDNSCITLELTKA